MSRPNLSIPAAASAALALLLLGGLAAGCAQIEDTLLQRSTGERVWRRHCAECHGLDGAGNTPRFMGNANADLTDDSWAYGEGDDAIEQVIREGIFAKMPAFDRLSPEEVREVIGYLHQLRDER